MRRKLEAKLALVLMLAGTSLTLRTASASSAIVVNTLDDLASPQFGNGRCGSGDVADLQAKVSLREAIIAANNTPGGHEITFDPSLEGGRIAVKLDADGDGNPDPLPALCGGDAIIDGDINDDGKPDVVLDGSAFASGSGVAGISVASDLNRVTGIDIENYPTGVVVQAGGTDAPVTVSQNAIVANVFGSTGDGIVVSTTSLGSTVERTEIVGNTVNSCSDSGVLVRAYGSHDVIEGTAVDRNAVSSCGNGVSVTSQGNDVAPVSAQGTGNRISAIAITRNMIRGSTHQSIFVIAGNLNANGNVIDGLQIEGNDIAQGQNAGIRVAGGQDNSSDNTVTGEVRSNLLALNVFAGILAVAGEGTFNLNQGTSNRNSVDLVIENNRVNSAVGWGVVVNGAAGNPLGEPGGIADANEITALVRGNEIFNTIYEGINLVSGTPGFASDNLVRIDVEHNTVCRSGWIRTEAGWLGEVPNPPNLGTGNVIEGTIRSNSASLVTVLDGTPGNTSHVTVSRTTPCPVMAGVWAARDAVPR